MEVPRKWRLTSRVTVKNIEGTNVKQAVSNKQVSNKQKNRQTKQLEEYLEGMENHLMQRKSKKSTAAATLTN